jgi:hypothetical protein
VARIRTIKPEFFTSLTLAKVGLGARLTFIGLWTYCDDEGRGRDEPRLLKAALWPLDDIVTAGVVDTQLSELAAARLIERYEVNGESYLAIRNWAEHQRIDRPRPSIFPAPPQRREADRDASAKPRRAVVEDSSGERKGKERNGGRRDDDKITWLTPYSDAWKARFGGEPDFGVLARYLKPVHDTVGPPGTLVRWSAYLAATEAQYVSPKRFAETHGAWSEPETVEMTDEFGAMKLHRRNASGGWEVVA